jgi:hypothetical protein
MKPIFKTHGKKTLKAPIIPPEKPKVPDRANKKALMDENTWLWESAETLIQSIERAIEPLNNYV